MLVARKPFSVYTWVDRGHYRTGDTIEAGVSAQTLDRKPVAGKGTLKLLKIAYDAERKPVETPVESWDLALRADGQASQVMKAAAPGQYRLSATIDDGQGHTIEGGYLLTITGPGFDSASFRYNDLEIIPERKEYQPGETLRLLINTNQVNSTVLLFVRPADGVYLPPKVIRSQGKSTIAEIGIVPRDMPNIFVEALTVADGKVHDEARDIAIPPESRIAQIGSSPLRPSTSPARKPRSSSSSPGPMASRSWVRRSSPSMTKPSSTSPAGRTFRRSRLSSGTGSATTSRRPNRASIDGFHNLDKQERDRHARSRRLRATAVGFTIRRRWPRSKVRRQTHGVMLGGMGGSMGTPWAPMAGRGGGTRADARWRRWHRSQTRCSRP